DTRLTPLRRSVLELVLESVAPVGAYTVLERLQEKLKRRVAPPTVYRALDFLLRQGLIHRIERFNAFVACPHPGEGHRAQFLICTCCGLVRELDDAPVDEAIDRAAKRAGFAIERGLVEIEGRCPECCANR
ncbi:MAG: Fur family transcriptional regulator, partial [Acetobacterales bacterium]